MAEVTPFHIGRASDEASAYRGWLVGSFADGDRYTPALEVKYSVMEGGVSDHPAKVSKIAEFTMVLSGVACGQVNDEPFVMQAGDYVLIQPGVPNNTVIVTSENATLLTVKAPSDVTAKTVIT